MIYRTDVSVGTPIEMITNGARDERSHPHRAGGEPVTGEAIVGVVIAAASVAILIGWALFGTVRELHRDGYRARDYDPDYDTRRPRP